MRLTQLHKQEAHDDGVWTTAWVPGSSQLLTGSVDETVKVWEDTESGLKSVHQYTGHTLGAVSVVVHATGQFAASNALDSHTRIWNLQEGTTTSIIEAAPTESWCIAFNPREDILQLATAGGTRGAVVLWHIAEEDTSCIDELVLPQSADDKHKKERFALSVCYSPDGTKLACGAMDGTVAVYDMESRKRLYSLEGHYKPVRSLCFTPDSTQLLTACDDMHVLLYDIMNGSVIDSFSGHESWVLSVAAHPNGKVFATGSSDSKVKLWDLHMRSCIQTVSEHTDQVWGVAFNTSGTRLASVADDKQVAVYSCV